jgi:hypothetical protein
MVCGGVLCFDLHLCWGGRFGEGVVLLRCVLWCGVPAGESMPASNSKKEKQQQQQQGATSAASVGQKQQQQQQQQQRCQEPQ